MSIHGDRAYAAFMQGFNCAQSVAVAFAPELGMSEEQVLRLASGFGAGVGRLREVCGAFGGVVLVLGSALRQHRPGGQNRHLRPRAGAGRALQSPQRRRQHRLPRAARPQAGGRQPPWPARARPNITKSGPARSSCASPPRSWRNTSPKIRLGCLKKASESEKERAMKTIHVTLPGGAQLQGVLREPTPEMPAYQTRPAVLVVPGGGYSIVCSREAEAGGRAVPGGRVPCVHTDLHRGARRRRRAAALQAAGRRRPRAALPAPPCGRTVARPCPRGHLRLFGGRASGGQHRADRRRREGRTGPAGGREGWTPPAPTP